MNLDKLERLGVDGGVVKLVECYLTYILGLLLRAI